MSQFPNTESANNAYRSALEQYKADRDRIKRIKEILELGATVMPMDIEWLCKLANNGIDAQEASWFDHG